MVRRTDSRSSSIRPFSILLTQSAVLSSRPARGSEGDKVLFVFDGGELDETDRALITLAPDELERCEFRAATELEDLTIARLARRVAAAVQANIAKVTQYLEHGLPPI